MKPSRIFSSAALVASLVVGGPLVGATPAGAVSKRFTTCSALLKVYKNGVAASKKAKGKTKATVNAVLYKTNKKLDVDGDGIACDAGDLSSGSGSSGAAGKKFTPKTYEGVDDDVITVAIPDGVVAAAVVDFDGEDGVTITSYDADENVIDTPVSSYGPYSGTVLLARGEDPEEPMNIATLDVAGEGKWKIKIVAASALPLLRSSAKGDSDAVYRYSGDDTDIDVVHDGEDSFAIAVYDRDGILVERTLDEYGEIDDTYAMTAGTYVVVRATASWSISLP